MFMSVVINSIFRTIHQVVKVAITHGAIFTKKNVFTLIIRNGVEFWRAVYLRPQCRELRISPN